MTDEERATDFLERLFRTGRHRDGKIMWKPTPSDVLTTMLAEVRADERERIKAIIQKRKRFLCSGSVTVFADDLIRAMRE